MEKHSVSRLIGAPPGYVGYDEGGQLTEAVRRRPYAVLLFDEIEKAHQDVFNIFLQILDEGRLTDSKGRTVDFKNTLIIMTSNIGTSYISETSIPYEERKAGVEGELRSRFKPEFLNRVDEVIIFNPLGREQILKIVDIRLSEFEKRLKTKDIVFSADKACRAHLADAGFDPAFGARPLKRAMVREIETPVARMIVEGRLREGGTVRAKGTKNGISLE